MTIDSLPTDSVVQELHITQEIKNLPLEYQKIVELHPEFLIGSTGLFYYDKTTNCVSATSSFCELLTFLYSKALLDPRVSNVETIKDLNQILQQQQGSKGGLLRKNKTERWELSDEKLKLEEHDLLESYLESLGFKTPKSLEKTPEIDTCVVFGARVERMSYRLEQTIVEIEKGLSVKGNIFLLGSNRKLIKEELKWIHMKSLELEVDRQLYWASLFSNHDLATEANSFLFLWETQVPSEIQLEFKGRAVAINSTRVGNSYNISDGHRVTTEVTIDDMLEYFDSDQKQSIFAVTELPYLRLVDQLRFKILTHVKSNNLLAVIEKVQKVTFCFVHPEPCVQPLKSVIFDEIARNVYQTLNAINKIEFLAEEKTKPPKL